MIDGVKTSEHRPIDWHIQSIRSAVIRESLGGVEALNSCRFHGAVSELLSQGYTEGQIVEEYKKRFPK